MIPYQFPDDIRHQKEFGMMNVETYFMDKCAQDLLQNVILPFLGRLRKTTVGLNQNNYSKHRYSSHVLLYHKSDAMSKLRTFNTLSPNV